MADSVSSFPQTYSCVSLFNMGEKFRSILQSYQTNPDQDSQSILQGSCVYRTLVTFLILNKYHSSFSSQKPEELIEQFCWESVLTIFLFHGTDFCHYFPDDSQSHTFYANLVKKLIWISNTTQGKSLIQLEPWVPLVEKIISWINRSIQLDSSEEVTSKDFSFHAIPPDTEIKVKESALTLNIPIPQIPSSPVPADSHSWDSSTAINHHATLQGISVGVGWFGRQCVYCNAFLISRRVSKKKTKEILLGLEECPRSPYTSWLISYRPVVQDKLEKEELFGITRNQLILWGFLDE